MRVLSLCLGLIATLSLAWTQVAASISGKVVDPSGRGVGGVTVTVKSLETGATRAVTTGETGDFIIVGLPLGRQEL